MKEKKTIQCYISLKKQPVFVSPFFAFCDTDLSYVASVDRRKMCESLKNRCSCLLVSELQEDSAPLHVYKCVFVSPWRARRFIACTTLLNSVLL